RLGRAAVCAESNAPTEKKSTMILMSMVILSSAAPYNKVSPPASYQDEASWHAARTQTSQLPVVFLRPDHLDGGYLDAVGGAGLAGLPFDQIVGAAGRGRIHVADSRAAACALGRRGGRPLPEASH